jgi:Na+/melibiose symporter-like transporter
LVDPAAPDAPGFSRVLVAEGISNFGSMLSRLAIPWLAALFLHTTPLQMAGLLVADVLTAALGSLLLASVIDRSGKRRVMLACDGLRCAVLALLALAAWRGSLAFPILLLAAAASGLLTAGFQLARSAWVAQSSPAPDLPHRNAQLSVAGSLSEAAAFALGGWLYQALGAALALAIDACSYALSALALRGVHDVAAAPRSESPRARWRGWIDDCTAGLHAVAGHAALRALAGIETLLALGIGSSATSYMIFVARDLAMPTGLQGMIFALGGVGAMAGAALAPRLGRRLGAGRAMSCGLAALAVGSALVPLAAAAGWAAVGLLVAQQILGDGGHTVHDVHDRTLRQTAATVGLLARVDAAIRSIGQLATLAGAAIGGALGTAMGTRFVLVLAAISFGLAAGLAALTLGRRRATPAIA